ncbi:MAG: hypothetical protein L6Q26_13225 [Anaerolineales bacterium]|nr:hypothetical protein [Anaerolineales bacterium]NUQ85186.1 hypothetical protein [Anaerolineales bacterium]
MLGEKWKPPVGGNRFYLVQLAFTLSPRGNVKVTSADFCLTLGKQGDKKAVVFDVFPREQHWGLVNDYRVRLSLESHDLEAAKNFNSIK